MITFIATTYREKYAPHVFIGSMLCQTNPNWKAIIYHNGANPVLEKLVASFNDSRLTYRETLFDTGCWGCRNRIDALHHIVDSPYVVQTSIQDYWAPNAVAEILDHAPADFIYFNSTHHSFGYQILDAEPVISRIDWGILPSRQNWQNTLVSITRNLIPQTGSS